MTAAQPSAATMMRELIDRGGSAQQPAQDMKDLADVIRALLDVEQGRDTRVRLGGRLFDVVVSGGGAEGFAVADMLDQVQGGCGPVIHDPDAGWLYWLVPPGSSAAWPHHSFGVCIGTPHTITLPHLNHRMPPGAYWLRPSASDRLVPTRALREHLDRFRPQPAPHAALASRLGATAP
ncbi:hypothetical protein [Streptomyces sp. NPDC048191]|uniref:hypothetical protein n=1 Tax=Streptomyces sp. NPDC048191 TaxID=3155484 RepID=UPI0033F5E5F8